MDRKTCTLCKQTKPLEEFYRDQNRKDGRRSACKICRNSREKDKRKRKKQEKYVHLTPNINYKQVLPKNKWPIMQDFLSCFLHYSKRAEEFGTELDVGVFIREYIAIKQGE